MEFQACSSYQRSYQWWLYISKWTLHGVWSVCKVSCFYQKVHNSVIFYIWVCCSTNCGICTGVLVSCILIPLFVSLGLPLVDTNWKMLVIASYPWIWREVKWEHPGLGLSLLWSKICSLCFLGFPHFSTYYAHFNAFYRAAEWIGYYLIFSV